MRKLQIAWYHHISVTNVCNLLGDLKQILSETPHVESRSSALQLQLCMDQFTTANVFMETQTYEDVLLEHK